MFLGDGSTQLQFCSIKFCFFSLMSCWFNNACRSALLCNSNCSGQPDEAGCNLLCQLNEGYQNDQYTSLLQCMAKNSCLPVLPEDGECVAEDSEALQELTALQQVEGKWWVVKGLNCGQPG